MPVILPADSAGDELYNRVPQRHPDDLLRLLCEGLAAGLQQPIDLAEGPTGLGILLDADNAPDDALVVLGLIAGVERRGLPAPAYREDIRTRPRSRRGGADYIAATVRPLLTGEQRVYVAEADTTRRHFTVVTAPSETPNPAAVQRAIFQPSTQTGAKPAGYRGAHSMSETWTIGQLEDAYAGQTIGEVEDDYATIGDLEDVPL